jgi:chromosome partitioning protein
MTARIIVVTNQKGGSGKTTVAMHLAGALARRDGRVLVVDADPQGTATRWASSAPDENPFPATVAGLAAAGGKVHREVRKFVEDYDYIVVDCPPAVESPVPQSALLVADVALVPIIPSPPDLWAGVGIRELISNMADINEGLQARLVANMCQPNTTLAREALDLLGEFGIELATTQMHLRTVYRQAAVYGGTVHGLGNRAAAAVVEVEALTDEVLALTKERTHGEADHGRRVAG